MGKKKKRRSAVFHQSLNRSREGETGAQEGKGRCPLDGIVLCGGRKEGNGGLHADQEGKKKGKSLHRLEHEDGEVSTAGFTGGKGVLRDREGPSHRLEGRSLAARCRSWKREK